MRWHWALPFVVLCSTVCAEVIEFDLKAGRSRVVTIESPIDESHLAEPRSYGVYGLRVRSMLQRIEVENVGEKPLVGRLLSVNERDWTNFEGLSRSLGLSPEPERHAETMEKLFTFWKEHRSHGGSGEELANEPFAALNFWGYTLCGEDTQALARLAHACDIPARFVRLNGHVAAEYRFDGAWRIVDGDQNAVYLNWDNETLAGADDLRADPLLGLRTKAFGKYSPFEFSRSAFNTALIEHIAAGEPKPVKLKIGPAPLSVFTLHEDEKLVWHCNTPPEKTVGDLTAEDPEDLKRATLATIEHLALAKHYPGHKDGSVAIPSPFPIWKVLNHATGEVVHPKPGDVLFKLGIAVQGETDRISVFSQCSRHALPLVHRGDNMVKLDADKGSARVAFHYQPIKGLLPPSTRVTARTTQFSRPPFFTVTTSPRAEQLWWQVSDTRDFSFVAPSLEGIMPWALDLRFDPVTDTFLSPGRTYYLRVKAGKEGLWGDWSEPVEFRVVKPARPTAARFESAGGGKVRLSWKSGAPGVEYDVFTSNRRDFIPEIFADQEILVMDHTKVSKQQANKNLLTTTTEPSVEFTPKHRFYRIIARQDEALSVPGPLLVLPAEFAEGLPAGKVLQVRASKAGAKDVYRATEEQLPAD